MITYQYGEYFPEDDNNFDTEKLMSILSELIMKYDISLDDALRHLIEKGLPVNIFLKEAGMEDLIQNFKQRIEDAINQILETFDINPVNESLESELNERKKKLESKYKKNPAILKKLQDLLKERNHDKLRRLNWDLSSKNEINPELDSLLRLFQDMDQIESGVKQYNFKGKIVPSAQESINLLNNLDQLTSLKNALEDAIQKGELFNLDLKDLAKFLGPESYQEFIEKREEILAKIKKILEEQGKIEVPEDGDGVKLSAESVRKIGMKALTEIFSKMKSDAGSGSHYTSEFGDSENVTSVTKPLEFGDSISNIDYSGSIINSILRGNGTIPSLTDLEVFQSRGSSRSSTVILLDMSGSMARSTRFYNAKKVTLAMDALIRKQYKEEKLTVVGFGSTAKIIPISQVPSLQPYDITIFNPYIKLKFNFSKMNKEEIASVIPMYFTNLQKGLNMARQVLSAKQTKNKQVILITDGAPTAHFEGPILHINYPPAPSDFDEALTEVKLCAKEGIIINTFLLTSEWDISYFGERSFIQDFASLSRGRIFYPHPNELNKMILYDFVQNKKMKIEY